MMIHEIFLNYDLSYVGDYDGLYKWLDKYDATECGDSACRLKYNFTTVESMASEEDTKKMLIEIRKDIMSSVKIVEQDRFFIAGEFYWKGKVQLAGGFIIGKRKDAPWKGRSVSKDNEPSLD